MVFTTKYAKNQSKKVKKFADGGLVDETGKAPGKHWRELKPNPNDLVDEAGNFPPGKHWRELTTRGDYAKKINRLRGEIEQSEQAGRDFQSGKR
jgi:hypothetical protein